MLKTTKILAKGREVVLYGNPVDFNYKQARQTLLTSGLLFTEVDVTKSAYAAQQLIVNSMPLSSPVVEAAGAFYTAGDVEGLKKTIASFKEKLE